MLKIKTKCFDIEQIADSGQCFRLVKSTANSWQLIAFSKVLNIYAREDNTYDFDCSQDDFNHVWSNYFDLNIDYESIIKSIPGDDEYLCQCSRVGNGIRILKQDPWEALISFIISQRKSIPAIRGCIEKLSAKCGEPLGSDINGNPLFAFPTAQAIASLSMEELNACGLGYRTKYIKRTASEVYNDDKLLTNMFNLNNEELSKALCEFYGVGTKVANCVMLFAYHRLDAFPVDVWIKRILDTHYNGVFPYIGKIKNVGVLQQYMFYEAQINKKN